MKRVARIVTGKTEEVLHHALKRILPAVEFVMRPRRDGFTSPPLPSPPLLHGRGAPGDGAHRGGLTRAPG